MKNIKRFFVLLLALVMMLSVLCPAAPAAAADKTLKFKADGTFRIMQISDTHCTDQVYPEVIAFLEKALDEYKPDLVVFTGDNVTGGWFMSTPLSVKSAIDQLVAPLDERGIPFTAVFGNHDWQTLCPKHLQTKFYQKHPSCLMERGYDYHHRTANNYLLIRDSADTGNVFNVWTIDSGSRDIHDEQNPVKEQQVEWYKKTSARITEENGGVPVPAFVFQHVPVEEVNKLFLPAEAGTEGAVRCSGFGEDVYYTLNTQMASGELKGAVGIGQYNSGEYAAWVEMGDVIGAFFGHNHVNDYVGKTADGITLGECKSTGFQSRGDGGKRGVRIFDLNEENPAAFDTYMVFYCDYFDEPYPEQKKEYDNGLRLSMEWTYIKDFLFGK